MKVIVVWFGAGLGNQMFQYAFYQVAIQKGFAVKADLSYFDRHSAHNGYELNRIFDIKLNEINSPTKLFFRIVFNKRAIKLHKRMKTLFSLAGLKYREESEFDTWPDKVIGIAYFKGFWQQAQFSGTVEAQLRNIFQFPPLMGRNLDIQREMGNKNSVSIHVRRGDYKSLTNAKTFFDLTETDYYKMAIQQVEKIVDEPHYFIFSDDIKWCRENLNTNADVHYIDWNTGQMSYIDMQLMSQCKINIIANSTFSWWAAWLNNNEEKIVIAPSKWFLDENKRPVTFPDNWMVI